MGLAQPSPTSTFAPSAAIHRHPSHTPIQWPTARALRYHTVLVRSCRSAQLFCHSPALFKAVFLNAFDPPPAQLAFSFAYRPALVARTRTELRLAYIKRTRELRSADYSPDERHLFVSSLVATADGRAPRHTGPSLNQAYLQRVYEENILKRLVPRPTPEEVRSTSPSPTAQLSSRLHCLANPSGRVTHRVRTAAREVLYEAASFGRSSNWGPFMKMRVGHEGGLEVDWRKMEAVAVVMAANIDEEIEAGWGEGEEERPVGWESTRREQVAEGGRDWAGVESGTWRGTYAFLDFRSFDREYRALQGWTTLALALTASILCRLQHAPDSCHPLAGQRDGGRGRRCKSQSRPSDIVFLLIMTDCFLDVHVDGAESEDP